MPAFFIAQVKLKDGEKFQAYAAQTKAIFAEFGAELITRGKAIGSIAGDVTHDTVAVMKFSDMQELEAAFVSDSLPGHRPLAGQSSRVNYRKIRAVGLGYLVKQHTRAGKPR